MSPARVPATNPPAMIVSPTSTITTSAARLHPAPYRTCRMKALSLMPELDPGIIEPAAGAERSEDVDGRIEPGHDDLKRSAAASDAGLAPQSPKRPRAVHRIRL